MKSKSLLSSFLFANVPLSLLHFILFLIFKGFLGQPGYLMADALGAANDGFLWWVLMVFNSLIWGAVLTIIVFPILRKILK